MDLHLADHEGSQQLGDGAPAAILGNRAGPRLQNTSVRTRHSGFADEYVGMDWSNTLHGLHADVVIQPTTGFWSMWFLKLNYQTYRLAMGRSWRRRLVRALLAQFWWLDQHFACWLDSWWREDRETAGYFVTARKP